MLLCSMFMCFFISVRLSLIFLAGIVVLGVALAAIMLRTTGIFNQVFRKYDDLNASVQENVSAIRVVCCAPPAFSTRCSANTTT